MPPIQHDVRVAPLIELDPATLYRILKLRSDVFVVEQDCAYDDLDGRDLEPDARQLWVERDGEVLATLRLLTDPNGEARIGRVVTAASARGERLAAALMRRAIELAGGRSVVLAAQSYLEGWYAGFGFARDGAEFVEDGIPHVPMRRPALSGEQVVPRQGRAVTLDPAALGMAPHPEGGWYRETWRHEQYLDTPRGPRHLATCVSFLLQPGEVSAWHRVRSAELWLWQGGGPVVVTTGGSGDNPDHPTDHQLHIGGQHLVAPDEWQTARPAGAEATLVACVVSPGFDFADFTLQ